MSASVFAVLCALVADCCADPWTASVDAAAQSNNNGDPYSHNRRYLGGMGSTGLGVGGLPGVGTGGFGINPYGGLSGLGGLGGIGGYGMGGLGGLGGHGMLGGLGGMGGLGGIGGMGGIYPGMMNGGLVNNPWLRRPRLGMPFLREEE